MTQATQMKWIILHVGCWPMLVQIEYHYIFSNAEQYQNIKTSWRFYFENNVLYDSCVVQWP